MKRIIFFTLIIAFSAMSCSDFLEEDYKSGENSATITQSEDGMESLVAASYIFLRIWYGKENHWDLTESGTDIYTWGADNRSKGFCTYSSWVGEEQDRMAGVWFELYTALNTVNIGIREIDAVPYKDDALRKQRKGELYFLRAHYLWIITEVWGNSHFNLEPVEEAIYTANKTPISTFYNQIFSDLDVAIENLSASSEYGRANEPVAKAFAARAHLMWASYLKNGLYNLKDVTTQELLITPNQPESAAQYKLAEDLANDVIDNYGYGLLSDWDDIWDIGNEINSEVIWAVVYSDDPNLTTGNIMDPWNDYDRLYTTSHIIQRDGGHTGHLMWEVRYENLSWGLSRDVANGRGFQRWMPTKYFIDLFDENADSRFYGSFKNVWYGNLEDGQMPKWKPFIYVDSVRTDVPQEKWAKPMLLAGDTAILFSKTPVPSSMKAKFALANQYNFHPESGYIIIDINDMYMDDAIGTPNPTISRQFYFPITKKYMDTTRHELSQAYSQRDAFAIRLSEMYLIAAEASMETGSGNALSRLTELADERAVSGNGADLLSTYGVNAEGDIDIDFLLDERARELATEGLRFWDLKRTGKLVERVQAHNVDASAIQNFHALRFIPQDQLDAITNKDVFTQNPGY